MSPKSIQGNEISLVKKGFSYSELPKALTLARVTLSYVVETIAV